ncbi:unnamed protein product [Polarella glacialis]|uniref:Uncharacterized protein n=1 Tax=Polarella glacialis TaxID=89957 RepID=A0A813G1I0_POLGL|nr:unnamed protein product [Polarella glacialis]CAE8720717.1 unnamed protein product [Polarella glacialis]|eukprot:CAMPEP_0115076060 /NCGR_PEP_ID=MMETSP0227-20121206/16218_1 /TAXON_ID=89957 /ORGANISM="Polarella glacialis, Strain CCMP 1383" /LENGTH=243 /DNA_ID=CAMNT_0002463161 /DNA_START=273 /DNA_END=1004 /DNA_ORIENTATION=-
MAVETENSPHPVSIGRVLGVCKKLVDYAPAILTILVNWVDVIPVCASIVIVAAIGLVIDFLVVRRRRLAGLPAVFPKPVSVTFLSVFAVLLGLLCAGNLSQEVFRVWCGAAVSGSLCLMALGSLILGSPFVYADAIELMPPEKLQGLQENPADWAGFQMVMTAVTKLWAGSFFLITCVNLVAGFLENAGQKVVSTILAVAGPIIIVTLTFKCLQPKVISISRATATLALTTASSTEETAPAEV